MKLTARVPATSANLGPGFDCFGLALDLWNEVRVDTDAEPGVSWEGEGADELPTDGTDMVSKAMFHAVRVAGGIVPGLALHGVNRIPLERGLGSSAAACVAGISLADRILDLGLEPEDVLDLATEIEGHPDNAAAAIAGGFTLAFGDGVIRLDPHPDLRPVAFVPTDIRLPTGEARAALPELVSLRDAVHNAGHAAATVVALTSEPGLLTQTLGDRLHQQATPQPASLRQRHVRSASGGGRPRLRLGRRTNAPGVRVGGGVAARSGGGLAGPAARRGRDRSRDRRGLNTGNLVRGI